MLAKLVLHGASLVNADRPANAIGLGLHLRSSCRNSLKRLGSRRHGLDADQTGKDKCRDDTQLRPSAVREHEQDPQWYGDHGKARYADAGVDEELDLLVVIEYRLIADVGARADVGAVEEAATREKTRRLEGLP